MLIVIVIKQSKSVQWHSLFSHTQTTIGSGNLIFTSSVAIAVYSRMPSTLLSHEISIIVWPHIFCCGGSGVSLHNRQNNEKLIFKVSSLSCNLKAWFLQHFKGLLFTSILTYWWHKILVARVAIVLMHEMLVYHSGSALSIHYK